MKKISSRSLKLGFFNWLWFFAFSLAVISPLFIIYLIFSNKSSDGIIFLFSIILIIACIFVGISIFRKKSKSILWAKELLITILVIAILDLIFSFIYPSTPSDFSNPIRDILFSITWLLYLNFSKRVKKNFREIKIDWKKIIGAIIITIVSYSIILFSYWYFASTINSWIGHTVHDFLYNHLHFFL